MAKPESVVRLRHRKLKHIEVHAYQQPDSGRLTVHLVDWQRGKVLSLEEGEEEEPPLPKKTRPLSSRTS